MLRRLDMQKSYRKTRTCAIHLRRSGVTEQEVAEATIVKVLDEKLPWYVVRVGNHVGWMHGNTLEFINIQDSVSAPQTQQIRAPDQSPSIPDVPRRVPERPKSTTEINHGYTRGPRGGCYYISASGRKVYVDRSLCN